MIHSRHFTYVALAQWIEVKNRPLRIFQVFLLSTLPYLIGAHMEEYCDWLLEIRNNLSCHASHLVPRNSCLIFRLISPHLSSPNFTSFHLTSTRLTSPVLTSPYITSPVLTTPRLTSSNLTSPHLTSSRLTSSHFISPHFN